MKIRSISQRRHKISFLQKVFVGLLSVVIGLGFYVHFIEPNWYDIQQVQLTLPRLSSEFDQYHIVQLSDIHADPWMTPKRIERLIQLVNRQKPDLVVLTGDYVTIQPQRYAPSLKALQRLVSKDGTIAVLGNHDIFFLKPHLIRDTFESVGIPVLHNEVFDIQRNGSVLHVAGVGDVWAKQADLAPILATLPETGAAVLLAHEPDFAVESAATRRFDLQLSGHSHGGQIHIPFTKRVAPNLAELYPAGQYQVGSMIQYTNRGVGMSMLHVRFNCRPEITVFTLKAPPQSLT
jgi:predicted MPP superfamily phosphohydrolase